MPESNIIIPSCRLIYMPVLKCASTSIKETLKQAIPRESMEIASNERVADVASSQGRTGWLVTAVIRHPMERLVSLWHGIREQPDQYSGLDDCGTFSRFVRYCAITHDEIANRHFRQQSFMLRHDGKLLPRRLGRYEEIGLWWRQIQGYVKNYGVELTDLMRLNVSKHDDWNKYYNDALFEIACGRYRQDIELYSRLAG